MSKLENLKKHLESFLKKYKIEIHFFFETILIKCDKANIIKVIKFLKEDNKCLFLQLIDVTAVDYISKKQRFEIIYLLLSHKYNTRLLLKTSLTEYENIDSICDVFPSANWYERECYDLFGVIFDGHPDLRRIMTDYNFVGHPLRKDFPLTGHTEVRYDSLQKKVVYEPVKLQQEYRNFDYTSPWEGSSQELISKDNLSNIDNGSKQESDNNN